MIEYFIKYFASAFAIVNIIILFKNTFVEQKKLPPILFIGGFVLQEIGTNLLPKELNAGFSYIIPLYTMTTTFLLTFYYTSTLRHRILITLTYQLIIGFSEIFAGTLYLTVSHIEVNKMNSFMINTALLISNFIAFLLIIIISLFFQRKKNFFSLKYSLMVFVIPIISLLISVPLFSPFTTEYGFNNMRIFALMGLIIANVVNYLLLDYVWKVRILQNEQELLRQQIDFQTEKYQQISTTYRNSRSFLHDTKKHFFYLQECIDNGKYENMTDYLKTAMKGLESTYNRINTGNLVIDSFVSSHLLMAERSKITFETDIQVVSSMIPVNDYDLCIILGNLLDNSMHECHRIEAPIPRYIKVGIYTSRKEFIIRIINSALSEEHLKNDTRKEPLLHGYGIQNIENLMPKHKGTFTYERIGESFDATVVLPIRKEA